ncbi:MAG: SusF/SusE family outer membrane protein, partial [Bacteroidales bacterium]
FTSQPNWDGPNYGAGATEGTLDTDAGAGNLTVAENGTWYFTVDTEGLTWTSEMRNFALIGSFNEWAGDEPLIWDEVEQVFTATLDLEAGAEFKFRANGAWEFDYGDDGQDGVLDQGGANIVVSEAGNYTITLDLYGVNPTYQIVAN